MFNGEEFGKQIVAATTAHVDKTVAPLVAELTAMRAELAALKAQKQFDPAEMDSRLETFATLMREERDVRNAEGKEKRKAALADLKAGIMADCENIMAEKIAAIPVPKDGKDADQDGVAETVATIITGNIRKDFEELRAAVDAIPALPDIPAMIAEAIADSETKALAERVLLTDAIVNVEVGYKQAIAAIPPAPEPPELPDIPAMIKEAIEAAEFPWSSDFGWVDGMIDKRIAALPPAENGKDADPELVAALVAEYVERAVAAIPVPEDGEPGSDGVTLEELLPVISQEVAKAVSAIPVPKDGRNAVDLADMLVVEGGDVVVTFTDGRTKVLGPFRGKDGDPGKDGKDADIAEIERVIAEKVAKIQPPEIERDAYLAEFAPDDVATNVSLAVKMMAAMPQTVQQQRSDAQPFNFSVHMPEMKASDTTVNLSLPEQPPPNVTVEPAVVNVAPANVHVETRRGKEITKVTGWDKNGRITSFEKTEE